MNPNDFYSMQSQQYQPKQIKNVSKVVDAINANNPDPSFHVPSFAPSQAKQVLNAISKKNKLAELQAIEQVKEQRYIDLMNGGGLGDNNILKQMQESVNGLNNNSPVNQKSLTEISNHPISTTPFAPSIRNIASQNLKYSQKRGKGCTDCSAFTQKLFKDAYGKNIGGWTEEQWKNGKTIKPNSAGTGDLVFFKSRDPKYKNRNVTHVGLYNGDGTFTHFTSSNGGGVAITPLKGYSLPVVGFKRYL